MPIAISLIIRRLQKYLKQQWRKFKRSPTETSLPEPREQETIPNPKKSLRSFLSRLRSQRLSLAKKQQINLTLRFIFWWVQMTIWLAVSIISLILFPQTRSAGIWLIGVPVSFSGILLGLGILNKAIDIFTVYFLDKWAEQNLLSPNMDRRLTLRIPIIGQVVQSVTLYLIISTGILLFLYAIRAPIIKEVAETMRCDAVWKEAIVEPAIVLGVDTFGNNSITIRLLIKTQPMKQWDVGREYRYRLKQAFDRTEQ